MNPASPALCARVAARALTVLLCAVLTGCGAGTEAPSHKTPAAQEPEDPEVLWQADLGNGFYRNPVLYADYSDPDVVAVGDDFYLTASSFNSAPGLPILHSRDLVNWSLLGHALENLVPEDVFALPQHGNGIWAPNIRYHDGKVWIFYPDPDFGIYMTQTEDPKAGAWSKPVLILPGKGMIDPTPLWDDDGQAWLLHAWAKSRSGKNNILTLRKMSWDGTQVADTGQVIIDGHQLPGYRTLEGPKFYRRNGYYYIFAPAGGVPVGWQAVFRSKKIEGPYESRTAMEQGNTLVNGPHQGAWVHTPMGEDWFVHFQSNLAYGRIVHLQPMQWVNDWPVIGSDPDGDGVGNPVRTFRKPDIGPGNIAAAPAAMAPPASDQFDQTNLGLQWQWNANSRRGWFSLTERDGFLRLYAQEIPGQGSSNLWMMPSVLLQKIPAPHFIAEVTLEFPPGSRDMSAGLVMFGEDYAWIGLRPGETGGERVLVYASCHDAPGGCVEDFTVEKAFGSNTLTVRMTVADGGGTVFSYLDGNGRFKAIGELFQAKPGRWVGARLGLFARVDGAGQATADNHVDIDSIHFYRPE